MHGWYFVPSAKFGGPLKAMTPEPIRTMDEDVRDDYREEIGEEDEEVRVIIKTAESVEEKGLTTAFAILMMMIRVKRKKMPNESRVMERLQRKGRKSI